jgi:hypothetical protein
VGFVRLPKKRGGACWEGQPARIYAAFAAVQKSARGVRDTESCELSKERLAACLQEEATARQEAAEAAAEAKGRISGPGRAKK